MSASAASHGAGEAGLAGSNGAGGEETSPQAASLEWPARTALSGNLQEEDVGRKVTLCGWVHRHRNMGGLVFSDLRDHSGIIQVQPKRTNGQGTMSNH